MNELENKNSNLKVEFKKVMKNSLKKTAIIVIIIASVLLFMALSWLISMNKFSKEVSKYVSSNPVKYNTTDDSISIDEEIVDGLIKTIEDAGFNLEKLNLTKEELMKLYTAEVVSSEINRGVAEQDGKYYGRVFLKRENPDTGDLEQLKYEPLETFEKMDASQILKYFSLDGDKVCIARVDTSTDNDGNTTSSIEIDKLNYKDDISQYIVPIEFLLDLCAVSQNSGFVVALADKIINETEIVIEVLQNKTETVTTSTYEYSTEIEASIKTEKYDKDGVIIGSPIINTLNPIVKSEDPEITTQSETKISNSIEVKSVNNWIVNIVNNYNKVTTSDDYEPEPEIINDESKDNHEYSYLNRIDNDDGSYDINYKSTITRKVNQKKSQKITTTSETYQEATIESQVDKTDEFIEMLKKEYPISSFSNTSTSPIGKLEDGSAILFKMLQNGERTQSLERIMRYILGKATDNDYHVDEFDFGIFDAHNFSNVGEICGSDAEEKVWYALKKLEYTDEVIAGAMGNIARESGFNPNALNSSSGAYGLAQWLTGRRTKLQAYATSKETTEADVDTQVEFLIAEITGTGRAADFADRRIKGGRGENYHHYNDWANATSYEEAAIAFCWFFETPSSSSVKTDEIKKAEQKRVDLAKTYYEKYRGKQLSDLEGSSSSNEFIGNVDSVTVNGYNFPHYLQGNYSYRFGSSTISDSGCGPTSLAMILAGLLNDRSINPVTVVKNLEDYYPSYTSYYKPGAGTIWNGVFNNNQLNKYYGVSAREVGTTQGIQEVQNGKLAIGRVKGHVLAIIPVPEKYRGQGYRFYIIDSVNQLDGPYKSAQEVIAKPSSGGMFQIMRIIEKN